MFLKCLYSGTISGVNLTFSLKSVEVLCIICTFSPFFPLCKFNVHFSGKCTHLPANTSHSKVQVWGKERLLEEAERPELCSPCAERGLLRDVCNISL